MDILDGKWEVKQISPVQFTCGHCGSLVAANSGFECRNPKKSPNILASIWPCTFCNRPNFVEGDKQWPAPAGTAVKHVPSPVIELYEEARNAAGTSPTCAVLGLRTLLMYIAVEKGAPTGNSFKFYVDYFVEHNYLPPRGEAWADKIRTSGNEAGHEISLKSQKEVKRLMKFAEMLLKFIYEFPTDAEEDPDEPE